MPQVYSEHVNRPGLANSNLGMYRVQISGGEYERDAEVGLHYQIHRGIGVHHEAAVRAGEPFRVNIFVGGAPLTSEYSEKIGADGYFPDPRAFARHLATLAA